MFEDATEAVKYIFSVLFWAFIGPLIFMLIWNWIVPELCGFNTITYWQSFFLGFGLRALNGTVGTRLDISILMKK